MTTPKADPLTRQRHPRARPGEARSWLTNLILLSDFDSQCIRWPFGVNAKGYPTLEGRPVRRIMTGLNDPNFVARPICQETLCINPRHLNVGAAPIPRRAA